MWRDIGAEFWEWSFLNTKIEHAFISWARGGQIIGARRLRNFALQCFHKLASQTFVDSVDELLIEPDRGTIFCWNTKIETPTS